MENENTNVLRDIKNCILQYEYPLANSMSEEELGDIFKPSNRCFLINWMLKLCGYNTLDENNIHTLGQHLHENGFCTRKESLLFMEAKLNIPDQLAIFQRIFMFIKTIKTPLKTDTTAVSLDEVENVLKNNNNLFPMFGEIKLLKDHKINNLETENQYGIHKENMRPNNYTVSEVAEDIQLDLSNMKNLSENCQRQKSNSDNNILFDEETLSEFKKCHENVKLIAQFLKDIRTIEDFTNNKDSTLGISHKTNEGLLKEICEEICSIMRFQNRNA